MEKSPASKRSTRRRNFPIRAYERPDRQRSLEAYRESLSHRCKGTSVHPSFSTTNGLPSRTTSPAAPGNLYRTSKMTTDGGWSFRGASRSSMDWRGRSEAVSGISTASTVSIAAGSSGILSRMSWASAWMVGASYMAVDCSATPNDALSCSTMSNDINESTPASNSGTSPVISTPNTSRTIAPILISASIRSSSAGAARPRGRSPWRSAPTVCAAVDWTSGLVGNIFSTVLDVSPAMLARGARHMVERISLDESATHPVAWRSPVPALSALVCTMKASTVAGRYKGVPPAAFPAAWMCVAASASSGTKRHPSWATARSSRTAMGMISSLPGASGAFMHKGPIAFPAASMNC